MKRTTEQEEQQQPGAVASRSVMPCSWCHIGLEHVPASDTVSVIELAQLGGTMIKPYLSKRFCGIDCASSCIMYLEADYIAELICQRMEKRLGVRAQTRVIQYSNEGLFLEPSVSMEAAASSDTTATGPRLTRRSRYV